jgi:hypothetical protein
MTYRDKGEIFEASVKTFNEAIKLRMKGGGVDVGNVEESGKVALKGGY